MLYIPSTISKRKVESLGLDDEKLIKLQAKYKQLFEKLIISQLDFSEVEKKLQERNYPVVDDNDTNFYHKYSTLGSNYIYFRNNIHIENLTAEEINTLESDDVGIEFLKSTFDRVLYEDGDYVFLGNPCDDTRVLSKSIMLEIAVDYAEIDNLEAALEIKGIVDDFKLKCQKEYDSKIAEILGVPMVLVDANFYKAMPDYFNSYSIDSNENQIKTK